MKFFKDLNKDKKIIVALSLLLILVFGGYQTNLTFKDIKISNLENQVNDLNLKLESSKVHTTNYENEPSNLVQISETHVDKSIKNEDKSTIYKDIKDRFINCAKSINKDYNESLNGIETLSFETMDLSSITDSQIKKTLEKLNNKSFNIKLEQNKLGNGYFYKIILIQ